MPFDIAVVALLGGVRGSSSSFATGDAQLSIASSNLEEPPDLFVDMVVGNKGE